jgi:hypothetical protein
MVRWSTKASKPCPTPHIHDTMHQAAMHQAPTVAMPVVFMMPAQGYGMQAWQPLAAPEEQNHGQTRSRGGRSRAAGVKKNVVEVEKSTVCFRNVPNTYNGTMVMDLMDANGFKDSYDFIYVPHDFKRLPVLANLGYFFTNFVTHDVALRAWEKFDGFKEWETESEKVLAPCWATKTQGLEACIDSYRDSPIMHQDVPLECKPFVVMGGKARQLIPSRSLRVKQPRLKTATPQTDHDYHGHSTTNTWVEDNKQLTPNAPAESACGGTAGGSELRACSSDSLFSKADSTSSSKAGASTSSYGSRASFTSQGSAGVVDQNAPMKLSTTWVADESVENCFKCTKSFTFLRRRHHCRICGRVFCAECAPRTRKRLDDCKLRRVCMDCADGLGFDPWCVREELLNQGRPRKASIPRESSVSSRTSSHAGLQEEPFFVVKNTFVTTPRSNADEDVFNKPTTSFPL